MSRRQNLSDAVNAGPGGVPPNLKRGKDIELSPDTQKEEASSTNSQNSENAISQNIRSAERQKSEIAVTQQRNNAITQQNEDKGEEEEPEYDEGQIRELARMLQRYNARQQSKESTITQKFDAAELLLSELAKTQFKQYRKIAETQQRKVNQGMLLPEALFTIYGDCAHALTLRGKKITKSDLMAKAMIAYLLNEVLPDLAQEE